MKEKETGEKTMALSRRKFIKSGAAAAVGLALWHERRREADAADVTPETAAMAPGPFQPNWDSLKQYECPEWFRDAKFGIWAHWTAQCVPEHGRLVRQTDVLRRAVGTTTTSVRIMVTRPKSGSRTSTTSGTPRTGTRSI